MKKLGKFCVVLCACLMMFACSNNSSDNGNTDSPETDNTSQNNNPTSDNTQTKNNKLAALAIQNAKTLYIAPKTANNASRAAMSSSVNALFKITEDGYSEEVSYTYKNEDGEIVESAETLVPSAVYTTGGEYIVITFGYSDAYLVSTKSGNSYSMNNIVSSWTFNWGNSNDFKNSSVFRSDSNNNIYYLDNNETIAKIDVSNPEKVFKTIVSASTDRANSFVVDSKGNILYKMETSSGTLTSRLVIEGGGYKNINTDSAWLSPDDNFYCFIDENINSYTINKITINNKTATIEDYGKVNGLFFPLNSFFINFNDRCIVVETYNSSNYFEVYNASNTPRKIENIPSLTNVKSVVNSSEYYFIAGNDSAKGPRLLKVKADSSSFEDMFEPDTYEVYEMACSGNNLTIHALKMSDRKIVVANININTKEIAVLNETETTNTIYLQRIN